MKKRVFIKTVAEECIGKVLLPSSIFLSLKKGKIEITAVNTPSALENETAIIKCSVNSILNKAVTLKGLRLKYFKGELPYTNICEFYVEKETEEEVFFFADGVNKLENLF